MNTPSVWTFQKPIVWTMMNEYWEKRESIRSGKFWIFSPIRWMRRFRSLMSWPHYYRKVRIGVASRIEKPSRQQRKQRKNRGKMFRGTGKKKAASADKNGKK